MKICLSFFVSVLLFANAYGEEFYLAVCAIFRNEAPYLKEWIEFHRCQGVGHFYLYDNFSSDNFREILDPYIENNIVTLRDWPFPHYDCASMNDAQCKAYMNCIHKYGNDCTWIAFIDLDEFLFSPDRLPLTERLKCCEHYPGIVVNWVMYGTSHKDKVSSILKGLVFRSVLESPFNLHIKSIVQPKEVLACRNPHFFSYRDKRYAVNELGLEVKEAHTDFISVDQFRINHYWSRDLDYFQKVKLKRRQEWGFSIDEIILMESTLNEVYDPILAN